MSHTNQIVGETCTKSNAKDNKISLGHVFAKYIPFLRKDIDVWVNFLLFITRMTCPIPTKFLKLAKYALKGTRILLGYVFSK